MVDVDDSSLLADSEKVVWLGLRVGSHLMLSLHSSSEPGELSQWLWAAMTATQTCAIIIATPYTNFSAFNESEHINKVNKEWCHYESQTIA